MADVTTAILDVLNASCQECGISNRTIDTGVLICFSNSSSYVTYRARLEGTSQADSLDLISLIEDWVESGGASIIVTGVILTVDSQCQVAISSLSEEECTTPSDDSEVDSKVPITTIAISAGVLGLIILFIIVVVAAIKYYRQHCSR